MLDKIFKHIHYYYIQPRKGAPPWWLNLLVLLTSLILVCFIWQPIKVYTVSEPISFSERKGDQVDIIQRSWLAGRSHHTSWMKIKFNQNTYWCNCTFPLCRYKDYIANRFNYISLDESKAIFINHKYCLVVQARSGKIDYEMPASMVEKNLKTIGPMQEYFWYKIFLGLFLLIYLIFIYKDKPSRPSQ